MNYLYKPGMILVNRRLTPVKRVVVVSIFSNSCNHYNWIRTSSQSVYGFAVSLGFEGWTKVK